MVSNPFLMFSSTNCFVCVTGEQHSRIDSEVRDGKQPKSLSTCSICHFQMAEVVESDEIPFHKEAAETKYV